MPLSTPFGSRRRVKTVASGVRADHASPAARRSSAVARKRRRTGARRAAAETRWRSDMGVEPTQDRSTAPQTVLKFAHRLLRLPQPSDANLRKPCKSGKSSSSTLHCPQASVSSSAPKWHQLRHQLRPLIMKDHELRMEAEPQPFSDDLGRACGADVASSQTPSVPRSSPFLMGMLADLLAREWR